MELLLSATLAAAFDEHVFVTSDLVSGNTAAFSIGSPWTAATDLEPIGAEAIVRHFFGKGVEGSYGVDSEGWRGGRVGGVGWCRI